MQSTARVGSGVVSLFQLGAQIRYALRVRIDPRVTVLATLHSVQGAEKRIGNVYDPNYAALLKKLIASEGVSFIFEEASGLGPTIAEKLALEQFAFGHYVDIDPARSERVDYDIPASSTEPNMIGALPSVSFAHWQILNAHAKREELWVKRMQQRDFTSALAICGLVHLLSFAFRLQSVGFSVQAISYANWQRHPV
jgi:hypothetical protein